MKLLKYAKWMLTSFFSRMVKLKLGRYLTSKFLARSKSENLLEALESSVEELDPTKLRQVGMDGPNVNQKMLRLLNSKRESLGLARPIDLGTCSLHVVCGALKCADESSDFWHVGSFLTSCYYRVYTTWKNILSPRTF